MIYKRKVLIEKMGSCDRILDYIVELPNGSTRYVNADDVVLLGTSIIFYVRGAVVNIIPQENHRVTCISKEFKFKNEDDRKEL